MCGWSSIIHTNFLPFTKQQQKMGILKQLHSIRKKEIFLASGKKCTVSALLGKHQRLLTQKEIDNNAKFNNVIVSIIVDFEGEQWETLSDRAKHEFVQKMPSADKSIILCEARQLSRNYEVEFAYPYTWNDSKGQKQTTRYVFSLISEKNRSNVIDRVFHKLYPDLVESSNLFEYFNAVQQNAGEEFKASNPKSNIPSLSEKQMQDLELVIHLNRVGCFPCKPFLHRFENYSDYYIQPIIIDSDDVVPNTVVSFFYINALSEELQLSENSHKSILMRQPRIAMKPQSGEKYEWEKITANDLDYMSIDQLDKLRMAFFRHEGEVDTVEEIDKHPDPARADEKLYINLGTDVNFFFPSGKV